MASLSEGETKLPDWELDYQTRTINVPKKVQVATVELTEGDVAQAIYNFVRQRYGFPFAGGPKLELSHGSIAWKSSQFVVTVTKDGD